MGLITSAGIGSGIDIERIIGAILDAERAPKEASLNRNEQRVESSLSAIGQLSSALSKLDESLNSLNSISDFRLRSANSSNDEVLTATADETSASGTFSIDVISLSQGSRLESSAGDFTDLTDTVGNGNLTLTAGSSTFDVAVATDDDLETIRDNINSDENNFGVTANIINGDSGPILVFTSSVTGTGNTLVVTNDDSSLDSISTNLTSTQDAGSAAVEIDGILVTSETNTFSDAIQDVSFTVLQETETGSPVTLEVEIDKDGVKSAITDFVDSINEFQTLIQQLGQSGEDFSGPLSGDVTLRLLSRQLVDTLQENVSGLSGSFTSLNSIGVTFDEFGKLSVDSLNLDDVVSNNFDAIAEIFAVADEGISIKVQELVDNYLGAGGILTVREDTLNDQKRRLESDRLNLNFRLEQVETQLREKFGALDALVAQFSSTGSFLTQQLANLPGSRQSD